MLEILSDLVTGRGLINSFNGNKRANFVVKKSTGELVTTLMRVDW